MLYCIGRDATALKQAQTEMLMMINNTGEAFILIDLDLDIDSFNRQFEQHYKEFFKVKIKKGDLILNYAKPARRKALKEL